MTSKTKKKKSKSKIYMFTEAQAKKLAQDAVKAALKEVSLKESKKKKKDKDTGKKIILDLKKSIPIAKLIANKREQWAKEDSKSKAKPKPVMKTSKPKVRQYTREDFMPKDESKSESNPIDRLEASLETYKKAEEMLKDKDKDVDVESLAEVKPPYTGLTSSDSITAIDIAEEVKNEKEDDEIENKEERLAGVNSIYDELRNKYPVTNTSQTFNGSNSSNENVNTNITNNISTASQSISTVPTSTDL